jgi:isoaspartyl peptidase/L-asparaginase-like protein (Ntn-hydrolase superfamily)
MNMGEQLPIPGIQPAEVQETTPIVVSKEDRLEASNFHLRAIALLHEIQMIQMTIQRKMAEHKALQGEIIKKRKELEDKYGIDLNRHQIRDTDGVVVLRSDRDGGIAAAMAAAGMESR